jgi:hypothetical protein
MTLASAIARAAVVLFWLATSAYAFLTSVPFVYEQFLEPGLVPALVRFAAWHGWLMLAAAAATGLAVWPDFRDRRAPLTTGLLVWATTMAGVAAAVAGPMLALRPGALALAASVAALVPLLWLAAIDLRLAPWTDPPRTTDMTGRDALVAATSALAVLVLESLIGLALTRSAPPIGLAQSLGAHFVLFAAVFAGLGVVRSAADLTAKPAVWEAVGAVLLLCGLVGSAATLVIVPTLSIGGGASRAAVFAFGATIAAGLTARGLRLGRARERDGVVLATSGLLPKWAQSRRLWPRLAWAAAIVAVAVAMRLASGAMDWNFAVAKLGVVALWLLVLATTLQWSPAHVRLHPALPFAACAAVVAVYLSAAGRVPGGPVTLEAATRAADTWVIADPSFRTLRDWLYRPDGEAEEAVADPGTTTGSGMAFFDMLQAHTNIARSIAVAPVPVHLAALDAAPVEPRPPHVFVFVVDSLRRDYLSPYNPAVSFTPGIDAFAKESTVYTRAFTRYGATGLSVPSIWVGGMILHKQYVTPFAPMNALHALLARHQYRRWMSMDNIVEVIMPRDASLEALDINRGVGDFRFCPSLDELRGRLDRLTPDGPPAFVWSLPQDIHVAVLNREGDAGIDTAGYDGLHAPYAARVRKFDGCFGAFVSDLKARGLYDESIIVLTSDHGDSLGEEGRWGHAYTIYPEVLQVPLIVRVPPALRQRFEASPDGVAFTTDITPTLYALLGHDVDPRPQSPVFGHPLMWKAGTMRPAASPFGLVASSYGSVYGWIDDDGKQLYIADGVALRDYQYQLDGTPTGVSQTVTPAARAAGRKAIRQGIEAIAETYRFTPPR